MVAQTKNMCLLFSIMLPALCSCAQQHVVTGNSTENVRIEKHVCDHGSFSGAKLIIHVQHGNAEKTSKFNNYGFAGLSGLSDALKLQIVEKLLQYKYDTAEVCLPVSNYGYEGYENTSKEKPLSKKFNIQVDALYSINRLCFPHASSFYYCFPVVFDTRTGKEVNNDYDAIRAFFEVYEKWFEEVKKSRTIGKEFPFNTGRYIWLGGRKS